MAEITLKYCAVIYYPWGCETVFHDGRTWPAIPHPELPHYHVIAHRCGYGDDVLAYCREHEVCHHLVAEWFHDTRSGVLWNLAHDLPQSDSAAGVLEEIAAQTLQRFIRANERPIVADVDWDGLRTRALNVLNLEVSL